MYRRRIEYRSPARPVSGPFGPAEVAPSETARTSSYQFASRPEFQLRDRVACSARREALVNSTILNIFSPDVYIAGRACVQFERLLMAGNAKHLVGKENALILCCVRQLRLLRNLKARMTSTDLHYKMYRSLFCLVLLVYDVKALAKNISKYVLQALIYQLFTLLVDGHFEDWENGYVFTHGINILIAQIVEKSDHTKVSSVIIKLLRDCSLNTSTSTRFTKLVMKSLWKVVKLFPTWEDTDLSVILYDIHLFMKDLPSPSWKNRYTDAPFRTIKTFLHTMTTIKGNKIFHYLGRIDNTNESELHSYLVKLLKTRKQNDSTPEPPIPQKEARNRSPCEMLSSIFEKIGQKQHTKDGSGQSGEGTAPGERYVADDHQKVAEVPDKNSEEMPAGINSPDNSTDDSMCTVIHRSLRDSEFSDDKGSDTGTKNENSESPCATSEGSGQSGEGTAPGERYVADDHQKVAEVPDKNSEEMPAGINSPDTSTDGSEFSVLNDSSKCDELSFKFNTLIIQGTPENSYDKGSDTGTENENSESPYATSEGSGQCGEGTAPGDSFNGDRYVADVHQKAAEVPDKNSEEMPAGINSPDTLSDDSMCTVIHRSLRNVHNSIQDSEFSDDKGSDTGTKNENSESPCATSEKAAEVPDKNSEEMPAGINSPDTLTDENMCTSSKCDELSSKFNTLIIQGTPENSYDDKGSDTGTKNENSESPCATSEGSGQSGEGTAPGDRYVADDHQVVEENGYHLRGLNLNTLEQLRNSLKTRPHENVFPDEPKGLKESVELMPHQKQALAWLMWREKQIPSGGILADDKGLGTTLTMISLILKTKEEDESDESGESKGGTLVICPAGLLKQWEGEVADLCRTDVLNVKLHHGANRDATGDRLSGYDMIITSYHIVLKEFFERGAVFQLNWERIILDDALTIRNTDTKTFLAVCEIKGKCRWALSGKPIHNNNHLYAITSFLKCSDWCSLQQLETIRDTLMLRRTKEQLQTL